MALGWRACTGLALALVGAAASFGEARAQTATLSVAPTVGPIGSTVTANASGEFCDGTVTFRWVDDDEPWSSTTETDGTYTASSTVTEKFSPGSHNVVADCQGFEGPDFTWPEATFTVLRLALTLTPDHGPIGATVTATASGRLCDRGVTFRWRNDDEAWSSPIETDGTYTATSTVLATFAAGAHDVVADCQDVDIREFSWPDATFTVVPFEILLKPNHGPIGTAVTAAAGGRLCDGTVTFRWNDSDEPWSATEEVDGVYNATSSVAAQLAPGAHDVAAECNVFEGSPDFTWRPATFTVVPLELGIQPNRGPVGTGVSATARGFNCPEVVFIWSGESDGTRGPVHLDVATATVTVPDDLTPEPHELTVRCDPANNQQASATFIVTTAAVAGLTLTSDHGPAGSTLTATATGFTCPTVAFAWDRRAAAGTAPVDGNGLAVLTLEVPADFEAERHVLAAQCDPLTVQRASATFDVDPVPRPAAARSATWWWLVIAALAVSLFVVVPLGTQRRGRRWVRDHLRVVAGAAADQPVRVREWSGNAASPDVVMRIEVHPAAGRHVLEEPDS